MRGLYKLFIVLRIVYVDLADLSGSVIFFGYLKFIR